MRQLPFAYAFRNLGRSHVRLAALLFGSVVVVLLVVASVGFVRGMQKALTSATSLHTNVILLGAGSEESLERSQIDANIDGIVAASIAGLRSEGGVTFVSPEIHMALPVRLSADDPVERQAVLRGVQPVAFLVHPEVEIVEGREPRPGEEELLVGSLAATRLGVSPERLRVGERLYFDHREWTIVGRFAAPQTVMDAEIWLPLTDLQIASRRERSLSCVVISLDGARFSDVDLFAKSRLDLELSAMLERDYYASIAQFYRPVRIMVLVTAVLIGAGGVLGGLNTMYASFASRVREVGMLQTLGFRPGAIVLNLTEESLFAGAAGAVLGVFLGLVLLDGLAVRFSMGAFTLSVDAPTLLLGLLAGLGVGLLGAVPPAVRCLRLPITHALKAF
ncbi:MAG: ABC transporter permease [Phycisphaeraceae bacterium]|nr:ABC transporter permease [Phycisphaeraceae bacterium]MCW5754951.1 ABC transporter permease [Phycisphaeraceae bacterium]